MRIYKDYNYHYCKVQKRDDENAKAVTCNWNIFWALFLVQLLCLSCIFNPILEDFAGMTETCQLALAAIFKMLN